MTEFAELKESGLCGIVIRVSIRQLRKTRGQRQCVWDRQFRIVLALLFSYGLLTGTGHWPSGNLLVGISCSQAQLDQLGRDGHRSVGHVRLGVHSPHRMIPERNVSSGDPFVPDHQASGLK